MYFTLRSIPELRDLPKADRLRLWHEAMQGDARWLRILRVVLIVGAIVIATKIILPFVTTWLPLPILAVALWIIFDRLSFMMWAARLRPYIRYRLGRNG
jgi:hypothetical protein